MKNVQVPQQLFMKLLRYHLLDDDSCADDVKKGLEQKMNIMVERELYTKSKTALTGMNTIYVPYLALFRECEVKK